MPHPFYQKAYYIKMENWKKRAVELVSNLTLEYKGMPAVTEYYPQKTEIFSIESPSLVRATPESRGISSARLTELLLRLESEERANVHSLIIVKDGEVVLEAARPGYSPNRPHLSHSMSKTVIGMALGLLVDDGKLDTGMRVSDFFDESELYSAPREMTLEHLLKMSSGASFAEGGSVSESKWTEGFFSSSFSFRPGEKFAYNSMNSYVIAVICDRVVKKEYGISLGEFLERRLFSPLGIRNYFWERGPEGIIKGGWGLYMSAESWAKLGLMMLGYGKYFGKRILSERWVIEATSTKIITPEETGDYNYGYQLWVSRTGGEFLFNGMLGQNVWVCPKNNIVAVVNSGNNELFQKSPALAIITETFSGPIFESVPRRRRDTALLNEKISTFFYGRQWVRPREPGRGLSYLLGLKSRRPFPEAFARIYGEYTFPKNNVGMLPVFIRIMQNNYQGGIRSFSITRRGELLRLGIHEGENYYNLDIGFYEFITNTVDFCGEKYVILACARESEDGRGGIEYKLELIFPELPNTRRITLSLSPDERLYVKMTEIPDKKITESFVKSIPAMAPKIRRAVDLLEYELGKDFIDTKLTELFSPEITAIKTTAPDYSLALDIENEKIARKITSSKLIRSLIDKFTLIEGEGEGADGKSPSIGGLIFSSLMGKIFPRRMGLNDDSHDEK